jgi:hypothetical protein
VHGQVAALLEDAHVFARQRAAGEGVVGPVLGLVGLLRRRGMALEVGEGVAAAVLALRGLVVVPVRQVGIARGVGLAVAVGLDLDALHARALVVVVLALDRHGVHRLEAAWMLRCVASACLAFSKKLCARLR